jgi:2-polyprenyl-3-methyl-5-hydroxy-6-metoxy-1,4-benzoquinol methylase
MKDDKAGKKYWDSVWVNDSLPLPVNPRLPHIDNYVNTRFHEYFSRVFSSLEPAGSSLLEIGCANSSWLPYFAEEFAFRVSGLDYSEIGCEQSRKILLNSNIEGDIVCADFFLPPVSMVGKFDVVITFGVVEHFADTSSCIKALSKFIKSGGVLVTIIPNMTGIIGMIERILNRPVYDIHVPLDSAALLKANQIVELEPLDCNYFLFTHFGVLNLNGMDPKTFSWKIKNVFLKMCLHVSKIIWMFEKKVAYLRPNRFLSPYVICVARKK